MNIHGASGFSGPERFDSGSAADPGFVKFEGEFVEFATRQTGKSPEAHVTKHWLAQHPVSGFSEEQIKHLISAVVSQVGLENAKAVVEGFSEDEKTLCVRRLKVEGFKRDIQKDVWDTLERMSEEGLEHEADRIELATMAAELDGSAISFYIHQLNISDQDALCKIAKKAAEKNPERTLLCIQNFRFSELEKLKEVFHSVQDPKYMNCFSPEATLETALIEIAKVNAEIHGHTTSMTFENYGIKDQEALVAIAKILARTNPLGTARSFRKFFIQREEDRIEIAKITASVSGSAATSCIKNYDIKDPSALVQIAKIAAAQSGEAVSKLIQNYSLSESARIEVAKIAAAQSGEAVSEYIQNYEIPESAHIEVAKIAAAQSGEGVSKLIQNFSLSESARIEVAKIAAAQNGPATSVYIKKYGITDQTALVEIAKIVAAQTGNFSLERFHIENEADRIAVAKIAAARDGLATCVNIKEYNINDPEALKEIFLCAFESDSECLEYLNAVIPEEVKDAYISQNSPEHQRDDAIAIRLILENVLGRGEEDPLTQSLLKLRNPIAKKRALKLIGKYSRELKETTLKQPLDIVRVLMKIGKGVEIKVESGPGKDKFTPRELKDEKLQQQLIITSYDLLKANELNTKDVEKLMGLVTGSRHKIRALQKISAIIALGRVDLLKECGKLDEALETAFADTVGVQGNDDFFNKFWNKFGEFRDPQALFIYAGQLNKLPEPDRSLVLQDLRSYIQSVITDKFHENRSTDLDPLWVEGVQKQVSIMTSGSTLNFAKLLRTSFADKHISEEVIQNVTPYLDNPNKELDGELKSYEKELILLAREGAKHLGPLLRALEGYQGEEQEIKTDVNGWISAKMPSKGGLRTYKLVDGDDPCDFLLMGTEVSGSCQRVDGDQANNKGLAGTMLDGHNRLLLLKDPSGKIVGRSLLRLVKESDKSALLLERIYPVTLGSAEKEALLDFAKERSKALGWSLYGVKVEFDGAETAATLTSVGGTGAYQYVDSAGGNQPQGAFVLESSRLHLLS